MITDSLYVAPVWDYIGSAWANFQDKALIEKFWMSMGNGIQLTYDHTGNMQTSRTLSYMTPTFNYGPQRYIIAYSGTLPTYVIASGTNVQIPEVTTLYRGAENVSNGGFEINTSGWTLSAGVAGSSTQAHTGTRSLSLPTGTSTAIYSWPSRLYAPLHFEAWIYIPIGGSAPGAQLLNSGEVVTTIVADASKTNQWQKISSDHLTSAITDIKLYNIGSATVTYVDDVSLSNVYSFAFQVDEWTYSIPTLQYNYTYNGVSYSGIYTEGVDYIVNNSLNTVLWLGTNPTADRRYTGIGVLNCVASNIYRINPALANIWCRVIGLNIKTQYPKYRTFGQDGYTHLKMFAWACSTHRRAAPSIYTLRNAYGIARGLPFAYASGVLSWSLVSGLYNVSIGGYTHIFPSGILPRTAGVAYNTFELIGSGLNLWDYTTNAGLISPRTNAFNRNNFLLYSLDSSLSGLSFSQDFLTDYITAIMPEQVIYTSI